MVATDIGERMEEGFQVVVGRKRRRVAVSASSTVSEVSKETLTKVFVRTDTRKLNPARDNNLLIILAKNDAEIAMFHTIGKSTFTSTDDSNAFKIKMQELTDELLQKQLDVSLVLLNVFISPVA